MTFDKLIIAIRAGQNKSVGDYRFARQTLEAIHVLEEHGALSVLLDGIDAINAESIIRRDLVNDLWSFVENVADDNPTRADQFLALRRRVRAMAASHQR